MSQHFPTAALDSSDPEAHYAFPMLKQILFNEDDEPAPPEHLQAAFRELDKDMSGSIDMSEFVEALRACGLNASHAATKVIFREIDKDLTGEIDLFEFAEFISSIEAFDSWERSYNGKLFFCTWCVRMIFMLHLLLTFVALMVFVRMDPPNPAYEADNIGYVFSRNVLCGCLGVLFLLFSCVVLSPALRLWCAPCVERCSADDPRPSSPSARMGKAAKAARLNVKLSHLYGSAISVGWAPQARAPKEQSKTSAQHEVPNGFGPLPSGGWAPDATAAKPPRGVRHVGRLVLMDFDGDPPPPSESIARLDIQSAASVKSAMSGSDGASKRRLAPRWSRWRQRVPEREADIETAPSAVLVPRWNPLHCVLPRLSLWRKPEPPMGVDPSNYAAAAAAQERQMLRAEARSCFNPLRAPQQVPQQVSEWRTAGTAGAGDTVVVLASTAAGRHIA